jgi:hypothetical protein
MSCIKHIGEDGTGNKIDSDASDAFSNGKDHILKSCIFGSVKVISCRWLNAISHKSLSACIMVKMLLIPRYERHSWVCKSSGKCIRQDAGSGKEYTAFIHILQKFGMQNKLKLENNRIFWRI